MSKYQESAVSADQYQRCYKITIHNPYGLQQSVQFDEEQIFKRQDGSVVHDELRAPIVKNITNLSETVPLYNPITQQKIGKDVTLQDVYVMIWSVYMNEALKRDRGPQPYPSWVVDEATNTWVAPVPYPTDGQKYYWDELTQAWVLPLTP